MRSRVHFRPAAIGLSGVSARAIAGKFRLNEAVAETAPAFLERVSGQARSHRAVHHPYLRALASGGLSDSRRALKDFARHYHGFPLRLAIPANFLLDVPDDQLVTTLPKLETGATIQTHESNW